MCVCVAMCVCVCMCVNVFVQLRAQKNYFNSGDKKDDFQRRQNLRNYVATSEELSIA